MSIHITYIHKIDFSSPVVNIQCMDPI